MMPQPTVLIGWSATDTSGEVLRERLTGWVRDLGFEPAVTDDGREVLTWVRHRSFAASLLDSGLPGEAGEQVWRTVRPIVGRRLVLMARTPRRDIWFEALRYGVGAVLRLPPEPSTVRAALEAATGRPRETAPGTGRRP